MHTLARRFAILAAVLPLAGVAPSALAQDDAAAEWVRQSAEHAALLDVDFPGGRLDEYYAGLADQLIDAQLRLNVVVSPQSRFIEMPAFKARAMTAVDAVRMPGMLLPGVHVSNTPGGTIDDDGSRIDPAITFVVAVDMSAAYVADAPVEGDTKRISIDFPGGPLADYLAALRRQAPDVNIVASERATVARIAPITLRSAPIGAAVQAVDGRLQGGMLRVSQDRIDGQALYAIDLHAPSEQTKVWSLAEHLQAGMNADDLLSGVEAAVGAVGEGGAIRFHAPTAMLIVRGLPDQVDAAGQAVSRMLEVGSRKEDDQQQMRFLKRQIEEAMPEKMTQLRIAAKEVEVAQARLREIMEAQDQKMAPRSAVAETELDVVRAEANLERIRTEIARMEASLKRYEESLDD